MPAYDTFAISFNNPFEVLSSILGDASMAPKAKIRRLLAVRGETTEDLAQAIGYSKIHIFKVLAGERRSPRVQKEIARHLGVVDAALWPREV